MNGCMTYGCIQGCWNAIRWEQLRLNYYMLLLISLDRPVTLKLNMKITKIFSGKFFFCYNITNFTLHFQNIALSLWVSADLNVNTKTELDIQFPFFFISPVTLFTCSIIFHTLYFVWVSWQKFNFWAGMRWMLQK